METSDTTTLALQPVVIEDGVAWPPDVLRIIAALDAAPPSPAADRRLVPRASYRARAWLAVAGAAPGAVPAMLFSRDVTFRSMGFLTDEPLPVGAAATLHVPMPDLAVRAVACSVVRCRLIEPGWFEGAVVFEQKHPEFAIENLIVCALNLE